VAQDFKPSIWEADVGRSLSLRLAQSIYRANSRISRTTQRNPIWNRPPPCVCVRVFGGRHSVCAFECRSLWSPEASVQLIELGL
jgi:hypothetical protein